MADVTIGGRKFPKWGVYASVAGGIGVVGYVYYKHKQTAAASATTSAATSATANSGIDPVTGLPYSEDNQADPLTGLTYLQEAEEYGSVSAAESAMQSANDYSAYDTGLYGYGDTGTIEEVPYSDVSGTETGTNYTSNAQWAQAVEAGLTDIGYSSTDISAALGRYLANLSLTSTQAQIVYAALAEYGNPPTGSFQVILQPTSTPTTTTGDVTVPNVVGMPIDEAGPAIKAAGLNYSGPSPVKGKVVTVNYQTPSAGSSVAKGTTVRVLGTTS